MTRTRNATKKTANLEGKIIKIKPSAGLYVESGMVKVVIGTGKTATYMVSTVDGIEWLYRDQFTIAR